MATKKAAPKLPVAGRTGPGGKFDSIGNKDEQKRNNGVVARLVAEIGDSGYALLDNDNDRFFFRDCKAKLDAHGEKALFGWKQSSHMLELARAIRGKRGVASGGN